MDLALVLILVGLAVVFLTTLNALGYFLVAAGVVCVIFFAFSGRGTIYRRR